MSRWSTTAGRFRAVALLVLALAGASARAQGKGSVSGQVSVLRNGAPKEDLSNVVVTLENVPGPAPAPVQGKAVRQRNLAFEPRLTVVTRGSSVAFPNDDRIFHNVFSLSSPGRFDLGLPFDFAGPWGERPWTLTPLVGFSYTDYDAPNPLVDPRVRREDTEWRVGAGIDLPVFQNVGLGAQVTYSRTDSNIRNYRIDNLAVSFGPTLWF